LKYTQNYNLRKPEDTDPADIQDLNYNADAIDGKLKEIEDWEAAHLQASNPHSITPALIGAETPAGAQAKVNAHEQKVAPHSGHETPDGAQTKANAAASAALGSANSYTDAVAEVLEKRIDDNQALAIRTAVKPERRAGKHTKRISGYGMLSIPNNANGQVSECVIKGQTWINLAGAGDTSPQTIENLDSAKTYLLIKTDGGTVNVDAVDTAVPAKITGKTSTVLTWASGKIALYELSTAEAALTEAQLGARYHYVSGTKSTNSVRLKFVGKNLFDKSLYQTVAQDGRKCIKTTIWAGNVNAVRIQGVQWKPNTVYSFRFQCRHESVNNSVGFRIFYTDGTVGTVYGSIGATFTEITGNSAAGKTIKYVSIGSHDNIVAYFDIDTIQIEEGTTATEYEPYKESIVNVNLPEPLRSVPSANDEISIGADGTTETRRNKKHVLQASDIDRVGNYAPNYTIDIGLDALQGIIPQTSDVMKTVSIAGMTEINGSSGAVSWVDGVFGTNSTQLRIGSTTITTLEQAREQFTGLAVTYQLAEPVVTPLDVIGELRAYPNGTVRTEPAIAGFMTEATKVVTTEDYPISEVRKVIRYDISSTGHLVETDVTSDVTVGDNNTSLTIANFEQGKTYFYDCAYPSELTTNGELILDVVVENGIITHDYAAAAADWVLDANEGKATMLICTNAGGAARIIAPACDGKMYVIRNTSGQTITIKTASSTGVTVANGKTATVIFTGNNFIKISEV
jgi:hypothetical protein